MTRSESPPRRKTRDDRSRSRDRDGGRTKAGKNSKKSPPPSPKDEDRKESKGKELEKEKDKEKSSKVDREKSPKRKESDKAEASPKRRSKHSPSRTPKRSPRRGSPKKGRSPKRSPKGRSPRRGSPRRSPRGGGGRARSRSRPKRSRSRGAGRRSRSRRRGSGGPGGGGRSRSKARGRRTRSRPRNEPDRGARDRRENRNEEERRDRSPPKPTSGFSTAPPKAEESPRQQASDGQPPLPEQEAPKMPKDAPSAPPASEPSAEDKPRRRRSMWDEGAPPPGEVLQLPPQPPAPLPPGPLSQGAGSQFGVPMGTPLITMNVEQRCVGFLIGPNGETIRQIREASGANTAIDQSTKNLGYSVCKIYGTPQQAELCEKLIKQKLAQKLASGGGGPIPTGSSPGILPTSMPSSPLSMLPSEEIVVDQKFVPFVVGKDGESLRVLQEETGTLITLDQSTKRQGHSKFKVQGVPEQSQACVQRIQAIITHAQSLPWGNELGIPEGSIDGPHELRVEQAHVGRVVGKGGESINQIRELTGAVVTVDDDVRFEGMSFVRILPGPGSDRAREMILAKVNRSGPGIPGGFMNKGFLTRDTDDAFMVDQWIVGYLIGKNGETLKMMKDQTGAKIAIDQDPKDAGYSILRIGDHGSPENIRAREAINIKIQECQMLPKNYGKFIQFCYGLIDDAYWQQCGPAMMPGGCAAANAVLAAEPEDVIWVDQWMVLPLIGKGGDEMRKIRESTQARIVVDQSHKEDGYSLIRITPAASPMSMKAQKTLHARVAELQARPENEGKQTQFYNAPTGDELTTENMELMSWNADDMGPPGGGCGGPMGGAGPMDCMGGMGNGGKGAGGCMPCKGGGMGGKGFKGGNMDWNAGPGCGGPDFAPMGMGDMGPGMGCMDGCSPQMGCMGDMGPNMGCMGDIGSNMGCMDVGCKGGGPMGCMGAGPMGCMGDMGGMGNMGKNMGCMDNSGKGGCCGPGGYMGDMGPNMGGGGPMGSGMGCMDSGCKGGGSMGCMGDMGPGMGCMGGCKGGGSLGCLGDMGPGMGCMDGCKGGGSIGCVGGDFGMSGHGGGSFMDCMGGKGKGGGMETMMGQSGPGVGCGGLMPGFYG